MNVESEVHPQKELLPRDSIEAGRQIDCNDEQLESASSSIRVSFDPDSNVNDDNEVHPLKDLHPRNSTEKGRQIAANDEQPSSALASI
jgi:hypothetical protein